MSIARRPWRLLLLPLLLLTGVAVATLVGANEDSQPAIREESDPGPLLAANRTTLSVCVDRPGGAVSLDDVDAVQQALEVVASSEEYRAFYPEGPQANEGCPPATVSLGTPVSEDEPELRTLRLRDAGLPSEHRAFVYIIATDTFAATFGAEPFYRVPAEMMCRGHHVCWLVTTGIYVPEVASAETLEGALLNVLGLLPVDPDPTPDPTDAEDRRRRELLP